MQLVPRRIRHMLMVAAFALTAFAGAGAATASAAITVSNPGTFTIHQTNLQFKATLYGFPVTITCSTASLTGSVSSSGATSITAATYTGCSDAFWGPITITPVNLPWAAQIKGTVGSYRIEAEVKRLNIWPSFGSQCSYNGGTVTSGSVPSPVSAIPYSNAGPLTSTTSGCGPMTETGTRNLSRSLTVSGSL